MPRPQQIYFQRTHIKPVMPRLLHYHPSPIYIKPIMPKFQHRLLTCIKPVMLRLPHHLPSPVSSLICSSSYIMSAVVRPQHVKTDTMHCLMPGKVFLLCSSPTSKACYAQAPTDILSKNPHQACYAQAPTLSP